MKMILFLLPLLMLVSVFAETKTMSVYTDLKSDCIIVSKATNIAPIDFYTSECKAFGGYSLKESGGDLRYGPELSFEGKEIDLQRPGSFHEMGSHKIEWVYDLTRDEEGIGEIKYIALIYRLNISNEDPYKKDNSVLFVVKLDGKNSCVVGKVTTNEQARKLASDTSSKCI